MLEYSKDRIPSLPEEKKVALLQHFKEKMSQLENGIRIFFCVFKDKGQEFIERSFGKEALEYFEKELEISTNESLEQFCGKHGSCAASHLEGADDEIQFELVLFFFFFLFALTNQSFKFEKKNAVSIFILEILP